MQRVCSVVLLLSLVCCVTDSAFANTTVTVNESTCTVTITVPIDVKMDGMLPSQKQLEVLRGIQNDLNERWTEIIDGRKYKGYTVTVVFDFTESPSNYQLSANHQLDIRSDSKAYENDVWTRNDPFRSRSVGVTHRKGSKQRLLNDSARLLGLDPHTRARKDLNPASWTGFGQRLESALGTVLKTRFPRDCPSSLRLEQNARGSYADATVTGAHDEVISYSLFPTDDEGAYAGTATFQKTQWAVVAGGYYQLWQTMDGSVEASIEDGQVTFTVSAEGRFWDTNGENSEVAVESHSFELGPMVDGFYQNVHVHPWQGGQLTTITTMELAEDGEPLVGQPLLPTRDELLAAEDDGAVTDAQMVLVLDESDCFCQGDPTDLDALLAAARHRSIFRRRRAAQRIGEMGAEAAPAMPWLTEMLADEDLRVIEYSAHALGQIGPAADEATRALTELLDHDEAAIQVAAAEALWRVTGNPEQTVRTLTAVVEGPNVKAALSAMDLLAEMGAAADAALPLVRATLEHEIPDLRVRAARALWAISGSSVGVAPILEEALEAQSFLVRELAAQTLGELGDEAVDSVPKLQELLADANGDVVLAAAEALVAITGSAPVVAELIKVYEAAADEEGRSRLESALRAVAPASGVELLRAFDAASDEDSRIAIASALYSADFTSDELDTLAGEGMANENADVRLITLGILAGEADANLAAHLPALTKLLEDDSDRIAVRAADLHFNAAKGASAVLPVVRRALSSEEIDVRADALELAATLGPAARELLPQVRESLQHDHPLVQVTAEYAIGEIE